MDKRRAKLLAKSSKLVYNLKLGILMVALIIINDKVVGWELPSLTWAT
jgi:hypothetical protein